MEKVTDKWFKDHGWEKYDDISVEDDGTIRHGTVYSLRSKRFLARWDRVVYRYPKKKFFKTKLISRFYMFSASGPNGFKVENRISHYNFTINAIKAAMYVVGYDEFGNKLVD